MGGGQAGKRGRRGGSIYQSGCFLFLDSLIYPFASCFESLSFFGLVFPCLFFFASGLSGVVGSSGNRYGN